MSALLEVSGLHVATPEGRSLFRDLTMRLGREQAAVVGRNGVGKSTLLAFLTGRRSPTLGTVIARTTLRLVPQLVCAEDARRAAIRMRDRAYDDRTFHRQLSRELSAAGLCPLEQWDRRSYTPGESRKLLLLSAKLARPGLLLLDEPTDDLDEVGIDWLCRWSRAWREGLLVVSHDRRLLGQFQHFFIVAESGCRYVPGTITTVLRTLEQQDADRQRRYLEGLNRLAERERHNETVSRRRARKKNVGRLHELGRRTSRMRLNEKRGYAQESQARAARIRQRRIDAVRDLTRAARRALSVSLALSVVAPALPDDDGRANIALSGVSAVVDGRCLFKHIDLRVSRERIAVTGPNASGKTTLLRIALGAAAPTTGSATRRVNHIGSIAQAATDWMSADSLLTLLGADSKEATETLARTLVAHKFPIGLAQRPMRSLSPGERVRAALICLYRKPRPVELLVLDEPTRSLDFVGMAAFADALRAWPGGLVVASHDRAFLDAIGVDRELALS